MKRTFSICTCLFVIYVLMATACNENKTNTNNPSNISGNSISSNAATTETKDALIDNLKIDNVGVNGVGPAVFNLAYSATKVTDWSSQPGSSTATTGKLAVGDVVNFDIDPLPGTARWQLAKFSDNSFKYVHPMDFKKVPPVVEATITSVVTEFWTDGDDKDREDGISETFLTGTQVVGSNASWGKDLIFRNDSFNLGQTFDVSSYKIPASKCNTMSYRYLMDNGDGWKVTFRVYITLSNGARHLVAQVYKEINSNGRTGTIGFTCN